MAAKFFGQFLLERGLLSKQQLLMALDLQRASNPLLGELAQAQGMLDAAQAQKINAQQRIQDKPFGEIAQCLGLLTADQVDALLVQQKAQRKMFGEILVEQKMLSQDQIEQALQAQAEERDHALQALELGVSGHPMEHAIVAAIAVCNRLFLRTLKRRSQFSCLIQSADGLDADLLTGQIRITGDHPLVIALACRPDVSREIAGAFLSMAPERVDNALSQDALGELINVLMGYVVKDIFPDEARYQPSPPAFGTPMQALMTSGKDAIAVLMASEIGSFAIMVSR